MKQLDIQLNGGHFSQVEQFIGAICEDNHIENYHATISVAVLQVLNSDISCIEDCQASLTADHCSKGICLTIHSSLPCFENLLNPFSESGILFSSLVDDYSVSKDGCSLEMIFYVRGISSKEAVRRVRVVDSFYSLSSSKETCFQLHEI